MRSWRTTSRSRIRRARRLASVHCPRESISKPRPFSRCNSAEPTVDKSAPSLRSDLTVLRGVGPALAKTLQRLDLYCVEDLLFLLPLRYEDRTTLVPIGALRPGRRCLVSGEVLLAETVYRGRRSLLVRVGDGTGQLTLRFFHFSRQQQAQFSQRCRRALFR